MVIPVPLGTQLWRIHGTEGTDDAPDELLADITQPGQRVVMAEGGAWRSGQRPVRQLRPPGAALRRVGRGGRGLLDAPLAAPHGRRRPGRAAERRQVVAAAAGCPTPSPRWPTTRSPPSSPCWAWSTGPARATSSRWPMCPGSWRGERGSGAGPRVPGPSGTLPAAAACGRHHRVLRGGAARGLPHHPDGSWTPTPRTWRASPRPSSSTRSTRLPPEVVQEWEKTFIAEVERLRADGHPAFTYQIEGELPPAARLVRPVSAVTGAGVSALVTWVGPLIVRLTTRRAR